MKNILLLVHDDLGQEARLQAALDIARALGAHLHCLDVTLVPSVLATPTGGYGAGILFQDAREAEGLNKDQVQERLRQEDVPWSWADAIGDFAPALRDAAGLADLIVVNRALDYFPVPDMLHAAQEVIVTSARPIVAVPDDARLFNCFGKALIAWDGSAEARSAMMAAVPMLRLAEKVTLLEIGVTDAETTAEEAATYLARHGIEPRIVHEEQGEESIGEALLRAVRNHRPSYVVMGGYGHLPVTEALFGGATRTMLKESPVPVFVAH